MKNGLSNSIWGSLVVFFRFALPSSLSLKVGWPGASQPRATRPIQFLKPGHAFVRLPDDTTRQDKTVRKIRTQTLSKLGFPDDVLAWVKQRYLERYFEKPEL